MVPRPPFIFHNEGNHWSPNTTVTARVTGIPPTAEPPFWFGPPTHPARYAPPSAHYSHSVPRQYPPLSPERFSDQEHTMPYEEGCIYEGFVSQLIRERGFGYILGTHLLTPLPAAKKAPTPATQDDPESTAERSGSLQELGRGTTALLEGQFRGRAVQMSQIFFHASYMDDSVFFSLCVADRVRFLVTSDAYRLRNHAVNVVLVPHRWEYRRGPPDAFPRRRVGACVGGSPTEGEPLPHFTQPESHPQHLPVPPSSDIIRQGALQEDAACSSFTQAESGDARGDKQTPGLSRDGCIEGAGSESHSTASDKSSSSSPLSVADPVPCCGIQARHDAPTEPKQQQTPLPPSPQLPPLYDAPYFPGALFEGIVVLDIGLYDNGGCVMATHQLTLLPRDKTETHHEEQHGELPEALYSRTPVRMRPIFAHHDDVQPRGSPWLTAGCRVRFCVTYVERKRCYQAVSVTLLPQERTSVLSSIPVNVAHKCAQPSHHSVRGEDGMYPATAVGKRGPSPAADPAVEGETSKEEEQRLVTCTVTAPRPLPDVDEALNIAAASYAVQVLAQLSVLQRLSSELYWSSTELGAAIGDDSAACEKHSTSAPGVVRDSTQCVGTIATPAVGLAEPYHEELQEGTAMPSPELPPSPPTPSRALQRMDDPVYVGIVKTYSSDRGFGSLKATHQLTAPPGEDDTGSQRTCCHGGCPGNCVICLEEVEEVEGDNGGASTRHVEYCCCPVSRRDTFVHESDVRLDRFASFDVNTPVLFHIGYSEEQGRLRAMNVRPLPKAAALVLRRGLAAAIKRGM